MLITVVICTYRRPESLELVLKSLTRMVLMDIKWELLVVDNDPNDPNDPNGIVVIRDIIGKFKKLLPLKYIVEPNIGLSNARNTGARMANGEYIVYIDDDVEVADLWLDALYKECEKYKPDFCGGPSYPLYRSKKPFWYKDIYATSYVYGEQSRWLCEGEWIGGMNFVIRRKLYDELGGFRTDLGMNGKKVAYGEDTEMLLRAWRVKNSLKVRYINLFCVSHEVRPEQMMLNWHLKAAWNGGKNSAAYNNISQKNALVGLFKDTVKMIINIVSVYKYLDIKSEGQFIWQQWVYEKIKPWLWQYSKNIHSIYKQKKNQDILCF